MPSLGRRAVLYGMVGVTAGLPALGHAVDAPTHDKPDDL